MVPLYAFAERLWLRISAQIYNTPEDYRRAWRTPVAGFFQVLRTGRT